MYSPLKCHHRHFTSKDMRDQARFFLERRSWDPAFYWKSHNRFWTGVASFTSNTGRRAKQTPQPKLFATSALSKPLYLTGRIDNFSRENKFTLNRPRAQKYQSQKPKSITTKPSHLQHQSLTKRVDVWACVSPNWSSVAPAPCSEFSTSAWKK
jgi:hypothetical protein